jgi:hypothetical protein
MILPTAYWPPVSHLAAAWTAETLTLEACENYQKGSWRNRCHLAGPNGVQRLSIPLEKGKHQQTPIREVRIAYHEPWQRQHWRSIRTAYGSAPFFAHYADELQSFYEREWPLLFDFNTALLQFLLKKMRWPGRIEHTDTYAGPLTEPAFFGTPYPQVFAERHGFLPDLSALDLLLCCGPNAGNWLLPHAVTTGTRI